MRVGQHTSTAGAVLSKGTAALTKHRKIWVHTVPCTIHLLLYTRDGVCSKWTVNGMDPDLRTLRAQRQILGVPKRASRCSIISSTDQVLMFGLPEIVLDYFTLEDSPDKYLLGLVFCWIQARKLITGISKNFSLGGGVTVTK